MTEQLHKPADRGANRQRAAHWLYFRRFLKNPVGVASLTPSSPALGRLVAQHVSREDDQDVVELGCGTGAITRALLDGGGPPERRIAIDLDRELLAVLRRERPGLTEMACDDARIKQRSEERRGGTEGG